MYGVVRWFKPERRSASGWRASGFGIRFKYSKRCLDSRRSVGENRNATRLFGQRNIIRMQTEALKDIQKYGNPANDPALDVRDSTILTSISDCRDPYENLGPRKNGCPIVQRTTTTTTYWCEKIMLFELLNNCQTIYQKPR